MLIMTLVMFLKSTCEMQFHNIGIRLLWVNLLNIEINWAHNSESFVEDSKWIIPDIL